jgi:orotidine-5'-phosphate decarboxylase
MMNNCIIVAMDVPNMENAISLAQKLDPNLCRLKVSIKLFTSAGPAVVEALQKISFDIFLNLKFKDIPNTVTGAVRSAASLGIWMMNVHVDGGSKMMEAAVNAVANIRHEVRPLIIGVTVLTSMDVYQLDEVGAGNKTVPLPLDYFTNPEWKKKPPLTRVNLAAQYLAKLAMDSDLDGVVCSGQEVGLIRQATSESFALVTPGIRLPDGNQDDQARVVTPEMAIQSGASYLVVGRPITGATDPVIALHDFNNRVASVS